MAKIKDEDPDLFRRLAGGEDGAFDELYRRYRHRLFARARRITKDTELAEDAVQEALAGLAHNARKLAAHPSPVAYMLLAVTRAAWRIAKGSHPAPSLDDVPEQRLGGSEDPSFYTDELDAGLSRLVQLPFAHREVYFYRAAYGLKFHEIAAQIEAITGEPVSPNTVATNYRRAVLRLDEGPL